MLHRVYGPLLYPGPDIQLALEIPQPELSRLQGSKSFFVISSGTGVAFRAHCTDTTTNKSKCPRCELREMAQGESGEMKASWNMTDGVRHRMTITQVCFM
ncbi:MAG: polysaccharide lyase family 7 protein [Planctomycetes bacterium]|nr:polysaccharide lyase family 7 protein [Planctomycetota bacterium]